MAKKAMSLKEAWLLAKSKRDNVGPNEHFMKALIIYENELRPSERKGEPPTFKIEEYYTSTLVSMGFEQVAAAKAVRIADGRFEMALNFCLAGL